MYRTLLIMQLGIPYSLFNSYYILFGKRSKNTIVEHSNFVNVLYSSMIGTFNNITLVFTLQDYNVGEYFNKYRCDFIPNAHNVSVLKHLIQIEHAILDRFRSHSSSKPSYTIKEHSLLNNRIKLHSVASKCSQDNVASGDFVLKISGLWETEQEYGLIYKFYAL